ncbi:MAG: hypothetical protein GXP31_09445 [Kiritimatiellaeota bacterium]|nr:hypothetical protein [Kiritimatiellota bacterium]
MISEIVVLLGLIGFLCIRNDYIRRRVPFLLAIVFWGTARILMEINFATEPTGEVKYDWASRAAVVAAACLVACLFCLFWACWRRPLRRPSSVGGGRPAVASDAPHTATTSRQESPTDKLKRLVEEVDEGAP